MIFEKETNIHRLSQINQVWKAGVMKSDSCYWIFLGRVMLWKDGMILIFKESSISLKVTFFLWKSAPFGLS